MLNWFFKIFIEKLLEYVIGFFKKESEAAQRNAEQKKKDEENLKEYTEAVQKNASREEIAKKAEDLLNGN